MELIEDTSSKKKFYPFGFFCNWFSIKLYSLMRKCEQNSKRGEDIDNVASRIKDDVGFARNAKEELFYSREVLAERELQFERCLNYVKWIGFNFRKGNYEEIDKFLKELGI